MRKIQSDAPNTPQELRNFTEALRAERDAAISETEAINKQTAVLINIDDRLREIESKLDCIYRGQIPLTATIETLIAVFRERKESNGKKLEALTEAIKEKALD